MKWLQLKLPIFRSTEKPEVTEDTLGLLEIRKSQVVKRLTEAPLSVAEMDELLDELNHLEQQMEIASAAGGEGGS